MIFPVKKALEERHDGTNELAESIVVYVGNDIPDRAVQNQRVVDGTTRASFRVCKVAAQEPRVLFANLCDASSTIYASVNSVTQTFLLDLFGASSTTTETPAIKLVTVLALVTKQIKQGRL